MKRQIERPTVTDESSHPTGGHRETHPAFGQIGASRVNGTAHLYGSDFTHHGYVEITIRRSTLQRSLSRDWAMGGDELIAVQLSNAQWAEFVSTMNSGMGVQCTIDHVNRVPMPYLPPPASRAQQAEAEMLGKVQAMLATIAAARKEAEGLNITNKAKAVMLDMADRITQELSANIPFYMKSFGEHMEATVEKAKIEVNAYVENRIHRAGLAALDAANQEDTKPPILMGDGGATDDGKGR